MEIITSMSNRTVKEIRALSDKKGRSKANAFLVEGAKFVAEISSDWEVSQIVTAASRGPSPDFGDCPRTTVSDDVFATLSDVQAPQGILAVVKQRDFTINDLFTTENPAIFLLEEINDPGNIGTILRTCHGLGINGIVLSPNCADIYSPKVVRASAGSIFHIPHVRMCIKQAISEIKARGVRVYATLPKADFPIQQLDLRRPSAFLLGNEHDGLKPETTAAADAGVTVPAVNESLNVSICAAILAYEVSRQRIGM